ncbi:acetylxylan esterase [bacterium]|nr:acetylxylan esterase [bacterium]
MMARTACAGQPELAVEDFSFDGPLGSQGTRIERTGRNRFKVTLGHAPKHPEWCNKLQFYIKQHAKGNALRLDVVFPGGGAMSLNEYFHSWSYDRKTWHPVHWQKGRSVSKTADSLVFPVFEQDAVWLGHQVPMAYEDVVARVARWRKSPHVTVHVLGKSLGGRDIHRIEITDAKSPHPRGARWVHHFANQHPGEHNSQWRMVGMIDWLLSAQGADCRRRTLCHFVLMMSPDAPSHGWYRVNAQGVDMNRSYRAKGASPTAQAHEAYIVQKDLEALMASQAPVTSVWSMHTWGGNVDPLVTSGPEMGTALGPWTDLRDAVEKHDPRDLVRPMRLRKNLGHTTHWTDGPNRQFGITAVLCEGAGAIDTQEANIESGRVLMRGIADYYRGIRNVKRNSQVYPYLCKLGDDVAPKLAWNAASPEEHRAWRTKFKARLKALLGQQPAPVPLQARWSTQERLETDLFLRRKVYIQSEADYWVPAYYFLPKRRAAKTPAIVCLHGHSGIVPYIREGDAKQREKSTAHELDYAVHLAEQGYITLALVQRGWNETSHDTPHSCHRLTMSAFLVGRTAIGMRVWDAMRALDFLKTLPEVDAARIGAAGLSGGGTTTLFFTAMDDRVSLAMCAGYYCTFRDSIYDIHHCICNCVPHMMEWGEMSDVAALIAPRPFLVIAGIKDSIFPIAATRRACKTLARTYGVLGAPDRLDHDFFDGPHSWSNRKTLPFLRKHWGPLDAAR